MQVETITLAPHQYDHYRNTGYNSHTIVYRIVGFNYVFIQLVINEVGVLKECLYVCI